MNIDITKDATNRIKEIIARNNIPKIGLRVAVDGGGCSGFQYRYELVDTINKDDFVLEKDGIKLIIDEISEPFLENCTIDYIKELGASYFQVRNPSAIAKCGCGNSFSV